MWQIILTNVQSYGTVINYQPQKFYAIQKSIKCQEFLLLKYPLKNYQGQTQRAKHTSSQSMNLTIYIKQVKIKHMIYSNYPKMQSLQELIVRLIFFKLILQDKILSSLNQKCDSQTLNNLILKNENIKIRSKCYKLQNIRAYNEKGRDMNNITDIVKESLDTIKKYMD
ncbi:unnamed protein product [Paramecium octaurelia]|uniref:Uncharacterized protein n=1 Tax=Paramecium octaurelia TaxID=43137 RepID=A0A8S1T5U5_PAROT|nr:unnamed protein product [Paramecium octaurelia]